MAKPGREFEANRRTARFPLQFSPTFIPKPGREFEANRRTTRFPLQFSPTFMPKPGREFEANRRAAYQVINTSASLDRVIVASPIGERFYKHLAVLPSEASIGDAFAIDEVIARSNGLVATNQVALDHYPSNG